MNELYALNALNKMRIGYTLLLCCLFLPGYSQLFPELTFQRFYDNVGIDNPSSLLKSEDGNLILGGETLLEDSVENACGNVWILKVDTLGEIIWQREIMMSGCEELRDMVNTDDGGILFTGVSNTLIPHKELGDEAYWGDAFLGKLDRHGQVEWLQSYGGSELDMANSIAKGGYRDYLIAGVSHSSSGMVNKNIGMGDAWMFKIDNRGNVRFSQVLGGQQNDWANGLTTAKAGGYILAGMSNSPEMGSDALGLYGNGFLARLSVSGRLLWKDTYACPFGGYFSEVHERKDGRIIAAGNYQTLVKGQEIWWMTLTAEGKVIREEFIGGPDDDFLSQLIACEEGGYLLGGYALAGSGSGSYALGGDDFFLYRLDEKGQIIWQASYGGPDHERCTGVVEYRSGVYYAIGEKKNVFTNKQSGNKDFWLLRVDEHKSEEINASIYVRATDFRINRDTPTRFRARYSYGEKFLWDFGDGSTSEEENPLKTYTLPGVYKVTLTVFVNENSSQTVEMEQELQVW
ncbi:MAG: PKD domain-containing protein [Bacteroidota bacterium]